VYFYLAITTRFVAHPFWIKAIFRLVELLHCLQSSANSIADKDLLYHQLYGVLYPHILQSRADLDQACWAGQCCRAVMPMRFLSLGIGFRYVYCHLMLGPCCFSFTSDACLEDYFMDYMVCIYWLTRCCKCYFTLVIFWWAWWVGFPQSMAFRSSLCFIYIPLFGRTSWVLHGSHPISWFHLLSLTILHSFHSCCCTNPLIWNWQSDSWTFPFVKCLLGWPSCYPPCLSSNVCHKVLQKPYAILLVNPMDWIWLPRRIIFRSLMLLWSISTNVWLWT